MKILYTGNYYNTHTCGVNPLLGYLSSLWKTHPVQEEKSGEVLSVERMEEEDKLGTVDGVRGGEPTAWEHAQL